MLAKNELYLSELCLLELFVSVFLVAIFWRFTLK